MSTLTTFSSALQQLARYAKPPRYMGYGTSGFRAHADLLEGVMARMGVLAALRSKFTKEVVGIQITASHNPVEDNGVKLVDPDGGMMEAAWEAFAAELGNTDDIVSTVQRIVEHEKIDLAVPARVFLGRDNRPSSAHLAALAREGLAALGSEVTDFGVVSTPQLHWAVRARNLNQPCDVPTYLRELEQAFRQALAGTAAGVSRTLITVDCANGAGAPIVQHLARVLGDVQPLALVNGGEGEINKNCGADYVQKARVLPHGMSPAAAEAGAVSLDGDADRVVFYFTDARGFRLLDGDKIAALCAAYVSDLARRVGLQLRVGVVQTAYANGASTAYLTAAPRSLPVVCVPTGVKHLHPEATKFDVGIYFEANGHGTVLLSRDAQRQIAELRGGDAVLVGRLQALPCLANQAIGDGVSDMLLVLAALAHFGWSLAQWDALYTDLPSRQLVVRVADRSAIRTTDAERRCVAPEALQPAIDALVAAAPPPARAFVRPSGTEDVVRVYAEAGTVEGTEALAKAVARAVFQLAGGVGTCPY